MAATFTAHQRRRVCVAAPCDERTFDKWRRDPHRVSELARIRIERAMRELELDVDRFPTAPRGGEGP